MTSQSIARSARLLILLALGCACGRSPLADPVRDGVPAAGVPSFSPTSSNGECPAGWTLCGKGNAIRCHDLGRSRDHCGACGHTCAPGILCQAGTCQQHRCKGALSFKAVAVTSTVGDRGSVLTFRPALGDFDGDGILDLAGMPASTAPMSILYGDGSGSFPVRQVIDSAGVQYWQALAGDVDGDGILDLASIGSDQPLGASSGSSKVTVRRGSGNRSAPFSELADYPTGKVPASVLLADLDSDGQLDLVAGVDHALEHWRGEPGGQFLHQATLPSQDTGFDGQTTLLATDWDDDGVLDLVSGGRNLHLRLGRGDGSFDAELACALALDGGPVASTSIAGDLDHDRRLDLVVHQSGILLGLDGCHATRIVPVPDWPKQSLHGVALADLDGDDNLDIVADADMDVAVRLGDGNGGFAVPLSLPATDTLWTSPSLFLTGDLNRDGRLDIVFTRSDGWGALLNTCP